MEQLQLNYAEFRQQYEQQHPASVPRLEHYQQQLPPAPQESDYQEVSVYPWWLAWLTAAMFITGALVAGVHTVYEVYLGIEANELFAREVQQVIALLSFVAIELSFFIGAFLIVSEKVYGWGVMLVAFLVSAIANVNSVNRATAASTENRELTIAVTVFLGIGVPLIALMAGKMFVNIQRANRSMTHRIQETYRTAKSVYESMALAASNQAREQLRLAALEFDQAVDAAWKQYTKPPRASRRTSNVQPSNVSNGRPMDTPNGQAPASGLPDGQLLGHSKNPDASNAVRAYLETPGNEDDLYMPSRQLAAKLRSMNILVGHATVNNVQREMQARLDTRIKDDDTEPGEAEVR